MGNMSIVVFCGAAGSNEIIFMVCRLMSAKFHDGTFDSKGGTLGNSR